MRRSVSVSLLSLALAVPSVAFASRDAVKEVKKTVPLSADGVLELKTFKGTITVTTAARKDVEIHARIEADGSDEDQAAKVEATKVRIKGSGASVSVESDYEDAKGLRLFSWFGNDNVLPFVHYTISLPEGARLRIDDYKGTIRVDGVTGGVDLTTYKGTVNAKGLKGAARLNTYKGDMRVAFDSFEGGGDVETYKGKVELRVPRNAKFDLDADTGRRGDFRSDFDLGSVSRTSSRRGRDERVRGAVNGGGPKLRMSTYKGTLLVREN